MSTQSRWFAPKVRRRGGGYIGRRGSIALGVLNASMLAIAVTLLVVEDPGGFHLVLRSGLVICLVISTYSFFAHAAFNTTGQTEGSEGRT